MNTFNQMLINLYLDWVNNFLSYEGFSEYYNLSLEFSKELIKEGKRLHELNLEYLRKD